MAKQARGSEAATHEAEEQEVQQVKTPKKPVLPRWDRFRIDVVPKGDKKYEITLIGKPQMTDIPASETDVEVQNKHSHSSLRRFYPAGTKESGFSEIITID
jgi:hypothetical protein